MGANFDVTAILKANVSDFAMGLKEAQMSIKSLKNQTGSSLDKVSNSLSVIGAEAMKLGSALSIGLTVPVASALGGIIKSYADLEQSLGGVETLFKDNGTSAIQLAKKYNITAKEAQVLYDTMEEKGASVISNANKAFKTAGVSANQYMQQVTSFSATLLQGLGGDTEKAAQYADKALVQMADNANKMGTNMSDIQNAYQGFAKDNYTMLDNLKLGYGGTAGEMARLVNESGVLNGAFEATAENVKDIPFHTLIEAIGITQDKLGITGTTAKEASETVAGSFQAMKASFENLVAGLGNGEADIEDNVSRVLLTIWDNLPLEPWQKWVGLIATVSGPALIAVGLVASGIAKMITAFKVIGGAISSLSSLFTVAEGGGGIFSAIAGALGALSSTVLVVIAVVTALIAVLVGVYNTSEDFRNKVNSAWEAVKNAVISATQEVVNFVTEMFGTLVAWWNENHALIEQTASTVWEAIKNVVVTIMEFLAPFIEAIWNNIVAIISAVWDIIKVVVESSINVVLGIIKAIMQIINGDWSGAWETIKETAGKVWDGIKKIIDTAINAVWNVIQTGWEGIKNVVSATLEFIKSLVQSGWNRVLSIITSIGAFIVSAVKTAFNNAVASARNFISNAYNVGRNLILGFVNGVKNAAGALIDAVGGAVKGAINWAKGLLGIHSPSRVFRQFGEYTDEGFIIGVNNRAGAVMKTVGNMAQGAIDAFTGKDLAGTLQGELNAVDGQLGRLTGYDTSVDFNGGTITVGQQSADIVLKMGNTTYRAFTEDITSAQEMELTLASY